MSKELNDLAKELNKIKNELKKEKIESFNCGKKKESKEKKYLHKNSGGFDILILESDEEMGARIVVEQNGEPVNILNKEILTLLDEINEKIKNITCVKN